jgi:hypothetical protein
LTLRVIETLFLFTDRIIIVSEDAGKEAPPLIIRNKLLRKEGLVLKLPNTPFGERKSHCLDDIVILIGGISN